jgi:hypothetical protein
MSNLLISLLGTTAVSATFGFVMIGFLKLVLKHGVSEEEIRRKEKELAETFKKD